MSDHTNSLPQQQLDNYSPCWAIDRVIKLRPMRHIEELQRARKCHNRRNTVVNPWSTPHVPSWILPPRCQIQTPLLTLCKYQWPVFPPQRIKFEWISIIWIDLGFGFSSRFSLCSRFAKLPPLTLLALHALTLHKSRHSKLKTTTPNNRSPRWLQ